MFKVAFFILFSVCLVYDCTARTFFYVSVESVEFDRVLEHCGSAAQGTARHLPDLLHLRPARVTRRPPPLRQRALGAEAMPAAKTHRIM